MGQHAGQRLCTSCSMARECAPRGLARSMRPLRSAPFVSSSLHPHTGHVHAGHAVKLEWGMAHCKNMCTSWAGQVNLSPALPSLRLLLPARTHRPRACRMGNGALRGMPRRARPSLRPSSPHLSSHCAPHSLHPPPHTLARRACSGAPTGRGEPRAAGHVGCSRTGRRARGRGRCCAQRHRPTQARAGVGGGARAAVAWVWLQGRERAWVTEVLRPGPMQGVWGHGRLAC